MRLQPCYGYLASLHRWHAGIFASLLVALQDICWVISYVNECYCPERNTLPSVLHAQCALVPCGIQR